MAPRRRMLVWAAILVAVSASGCAKRPALTQAAAPAPTGGTAARPPEPSNLAPPGGRAESPPAAAATPPASPAPAPPVAAATPTPAAPAKPAVAEFSPVAELADIHFDFDKSEIRPDAAKVLQTSADWLNAHANQAVLIEGHCDERGTNEYNLALGDRRAKATRDFLVARGVATSRISLISYGEERPLCTEHTESCWSRNRRAHFLVKPE
jgi:peptidoglycan-associated lipoprotein